MTVTSSNYLSGWLKKLHHWSWIWLDGSCWIIIFRRKCSLHICELGLKDECWRVTDWYVKRMQLKHNLSLIVILGSINSINFNYEANLLIIRGRNFVTIDSSTLSSSLFHRSLHYFTFGNSNKVVFFFKWDN